MVPQRPIINAEASPRQSLVSQLVGRSVGDYSDEREEGLERPFTTYYKRHVVKPPRCAVKHHRSIYTSASSTLLETEGVHTYQYLPVTGRTYRAQQLNSS